MLKKTNLFLSLWNNATKLFFRNGYNFVSSAATNREVLIFQNSRMKVTITLLFSGLVYLLSGQANRSTSEIRREMEGLKSVGKVLYMAAHPDDENTRLIAYFAKKEHFETAYFSLTRGDGGQNLIGDEKGDELGIIRTQELLQARNIDGGKQFFSNAVDFGYTRSENETLEKWGYDEVLADAVYVFRTFRPNVVVLRFPPDGNGGHGHHTASASIAIDAAKASADEAYKLKTYPDLTPWEITGIYVNTGRWWVPNIDSVAQAHPEKYLQINVGEYDALSGQSYTEIAGLSRSQHKSQGFGAALAKGNQFEYLELVYGTNALSNPSFGRLEDKSGMSAYRDFEKKVDELIGKFEDNYPWQSITRLLELKKIVESTENESWRILKIEAINSLIKECLGLEIEVLSPDDKWVQGSTAKLKFKALNRSPIDLKLSSIKGLDMDSTLDADLKTNQWMEIEMEADLPNDYPLSTPYWLNQPHQNRFEINDPSTQGLPQKEVSPSYVFRFQLEGQELTFKTQATYKSVDRVKGERSHPVFITPPVTIHPEIKTHIFNYGQKKTLRLAVTNHLPQKTLRLETKLADGWVGPAFIDVEFESPGETKWISLTIEAPSENKVLTWQPYASTGENAYDTDQIIIAYDHIKSQAYCPKVSLKLVSVDLNTVGSQIGYVNGAGDEVANALRQMGYHVTELTPADLSNDLSGYDALVFGVRAYNVHPELNQYHSILMNYVNDGGHVVMQYHTSRGMDIPLGPYPFKLSRERITDEEAPVILASDPDLLFRYPNLISMKDFDGWVQERGLYFADDIDPNYRTPIGFAGENNKLLKGSLLTTSYGKGSYTYTSLSFFRQLPAGVPGAYRLFANIVAGGQEKSELNTNGSKIIDKP